MFCDCPNKMSSLGFAKLFGVILIFEELFRNHVPFFSFMFPSLFPCLSLSLQVICLFVRFKLQSTHLKNKTKSSCFSINISKSSEAQN